MVLEEPGVNGWWLLPGTIPAGALNATTPRIKTSEILIPIEATSLRTLCDDFWPKSESCMYSALVTRKVLVERNRV